MLADRVRMGSLTKTVGLLWFNFDIIYSPMRAQTNEIVIPYDITIYADVPFYENAQFTWEINEDSHFGYGKDDTEWKTGMQTVELKKGDTFFIRLDSFRREDFEGKVILRLDDESGQKIAEFDFKIKTEF